MPERKVKRSQGLGDTVEKVAKKTGVKKLVEFFTPEGKDCGCDKRKETLNRLFPYNKPNCMNKEQYDAWTKFKNRKDKNKVTSQQQDLIVGLLLDIHNMSVSKCPNCNGAIWKKWIRMIDQVYETYEQNK